MVLFISLNCLADSRISTIPPGEDKIVVVREGDKVPFTGQLFDNNTALRWGNWLLQYKFRLKEDVEYQQKIAHNEVSYMKQLLDIERKKYLTVTDDYQKLIAVEKQENVKMRAQLDNPPFYKTAWFGFLSGVLVTTACVGAGILIGMAAKN